MENRMKTRIKTALLCFGFLVAAAVLPGGVSADVSTYPDSDVFDSPPPAASAHGKRACAPAQRYVELIAAVRYDEVGTLFADDAVFVTPIGKVLHGSTDIGKFYAELMPKLKPRNVPISFIADGDECIMELVSATNLDNYGKYRLAAIDHFTVNKQGKIRHLIVYLRPQSMQGAPAPQKAQ
jgi:hypothetical protein